MTIETPEKTPSLGRIYDAIADVKVDVAVIKDRLPDIADHETRIRALERRVWAIFGGLATLVAAGNYLQLVFNR